MATNRNVAFGKDDKNDSPVTQTQLPGKMQGNPTQLSGGMTSTEKVSPPFINSIIQIMRPDIDSSGHCLRSHIIDDFVFL